MLFDTSVLWPKTTNNYWSHFTSLSCCDTDAVKWSCIINIPKFLRKLQYRRPLFDSPSSISHCGKLLDRRNNYGWIPAGFEWKNNKQSIHLKWKRSESALCTFAAKWACSRKQQNVKIKPVHRSSTVFSNKDGHHKIALKNLLRYDAALESDIWLVVDGVAYIIHT